MDETKKGNQSTGSVEEIKSKGNECVKEGKYVEAVLHYTQAIKLDVNNYVLYSNRSFAFLKLDQHYLALQDANETVRLQPNWFKGYFRRAEVESGSGLYDEAIISYTRALQLEPHNTELMEAIKKLTEQQKKKIIDNRNIIWISTCVGLILGILVVICDYTLTEKPTLSHPVSMVAFSLAISGLGFAIGKTSILMKGWETGKLLVPPPELSSNGNVNENESVIPEKRPKYSKAQARQRYKQGKI